jgi:hypothetical protein
MNCNNCKVEVNSKYCPDCGHPTTLKRIDGHYIIHEIEHVLHFERGILYTIRELLINPGKNVRNYLLENRSRLVKPIIFIIISSLIYTLCNKVFHFEEAYIKNLETKKSTAIEIFKWVQGHYGYSNIFLGIFISFWTRLFFKKHNFNFFEILILLCFVIGMGMLIYAVFGTIEGLTNIPLMQIGGLVVFCYTTWAVGNFYGKEKIINYVKAFFAYLLGMITAALTVVLIGTLFDLITKNG